MHYTYLSATVFGLLSAVSAHPTSRAATGQAAYFLTNENKNEVVALKIGKDGTVTEGSRTATGGAGSAGFDSNTNATAGPDALFSQAPLTVEGNFLFAVNAGCNTVSMMAIDPADATKLTPLGQPQDTLGEFPLSVAADEKSMKVCVANSGAKAGVACASFCAEGGIGAMDALRPFDIGQKTPPIGPLNTVSHTLFTEDGSSLITMVKGDGKQNAGFVSRFAVENGVVGMQETRSSPDGTGALFGTTNIPGTGNLLATDATFGAAILALDQQGAATVVKSLKLKDQVATCWSTVSDATGTGFVSDVAVNHLVEMDLETGELVRDLDLNNGNPGLIDMTARGSFVYGLSPGNATVAPAVSVFDVSGGRGSAKVIQNFRPQGLLAGRSAGMVSI